MAASALEDFQVMNAQQEGTNGADQQRSLIIWKPPPVNMVKVNWDVAINK